MQMTRVQCTLKKNVCIIEDTLNKNFNSMRDRCVENKPSTFVYILVRIKQDQSFLELSVD